MLLLGVKAKAGRGVTEDLRTSVGVALDRGARACEVPVPVHVVDAAHSGPGAGPDGGSRESKGPR